MHVHGRVHVCVFSLWQWYEGCIEGCSAIPFAKYSFTQSTSLHFHLRQHRSSDHPHLQKVKKGTAAWWCSDPNPGAFSPGAKWTSALVTLALGGSEDDKDSHTSGPDSGR